MQLILRKIKHLYNCLKSLFVVIVNAII